MLAGALALTGVGAAQTNQSSGVSARVGIFFPSNSTTADAGSTWLSFGLDYRIQQVNAPAVTMRNGTGTFFSVSGDYYDKGSYRNIPIAVNYNVRSQQLIFSVGVGADIETVLDHETIGLGGNVAVTYEFAGSGKNANTPLFLEAKYFIASNSALNGLGVYVGLRF